MPGGRAKDQEFIGCWCNRAFANKIDIARAMCHLDRSKFARKALRHFLREEFKIAVSDEEYYQPDRKGKGGRKPARSPSGVPASIYDKIATEAAREWPGDFSMQKYTIGRQVDSYLKLHPR